MKTLEITEADNGFIVKQGTRLIIVAKVEELHHLIEDLWGKQDGFGEGRPLKDMREIVKNIGQRKDK